MGVAAAHRVQGSSQPLGLQQVVPEVGWGAERRSVGAAESLSSHALTDASL